jgi:hypothetical protein
VTRSRGQAVGCRFPVPRWPRRGVFERIRILHVPTCATRPAIVSTVGALDAFIEHGPKDTDFFIRKIAVRFDIPLVFPRRRPWRDARRPIDGGPSLVAKRLSKDFLQVLRCGRGMLPTNGNALAGRLAKPGFDLGIPLWLSSPAKELILDNGAVRGAVVDREGKRVRVVAHRGVVLVCGGFPHDVARRKELFPHAPTGKEHYSPGPTGTPATDCVWPKRSAVKWILLWHTLPLR